MALQASSRTYFAFPSWLRACASRTFNHRVCNSESVCSCPVVTVCSCPVVIPWVLPAAAFDRTQLCTKNLELLNPETYAKTCTKEARPIEHLYNMNYIWILILHSEFCFLVPNFRFGYWVLMMYILFFLSTFLISNNTQQLLNLNENPNPRRQTEIFSSTTNTWTSTIKIFFLYPLQYFFKNIYCACDMKVKIIVAKCKLLTWVFLLLCI